jgi:hypothetical protein
VRWRGAAGVAPKSRLFFLSAQDFADAIQILAGGGIEKERHITAEIPLHDIVAHGFVPLSEQRAAHIKIQVYPHA